MATGNVKKFVKELKTLCECNICYAEYDEDSHVPRVLPCQHTFCTECLSKYCKRQKIKCFLCNQEYFAKNGDVKVFLKDYTRRDLKELLENFYSSFCRVCQINNNAKYFYSTCNIAMCPGCYGERNCDRHNVKILQNHSETQNTMLDSTDINSKSICSLSGHENNELKYFCTSKSCNKPVCSNCIVESHEKHTYKSVKTEYENRKKNMKIMCEATQMKISQVRKCLENIEKQAASLTDSGRKGRDNMGLIVNKGIAYIKDYAENATKKTDEILKHNLNILKKGKEQLECFIENATECCAVSEKALTENNYITFLSVEKTLTAKLNSFEQSELDKRLDVMQTEDLELKRPIRELGNKIEQMMKEDKVNDRPNLLRRLWNVCWRKSNQHQRKSCLRSFLSKLAYVFLFGFLFLRLSTISYTSVFQTDYSYLAFRNSKSSLMCFSRNKKMVSNVPMDNILQTCGKAESTYIFNGVFTNTSFLYGNDESVMLQVQVSNIKTSFPGLILFEFGISKGSINRKYIFGPPSFMLYGWFLKILNRRNKCALINTEGQIVYTSLISVPNSTFNFGIEFNSNRKISLKTQSKRLSVKMYETLDETRSIKGKPKWVFVKTCDSHDANVSVQILNDHMAYNKSTLHPSVYMSVNNKTISNTKIPTFSTNQVEKSSIYQDIMLYNCSTECVYVVNFRVNSPQHLDVFKLVITNSQFLPSAYYNVTLLSYGLCSIVNKETFQFCVTVYKRGHSRVYPIYLIEDVPNKWHSLIIKVKRHSYSASFLLETVQTEIQDGFLFENETPILRWILQNTKDSVEIKLGDREDFIMLDWFVHQILPYRENIFSISFVLLLLLTIGVIITVRNGDFINYLQAIINFAIQTRQFKIENRPENVERRHRVRRQRIH